MKVLALDLSTRSTGYSIGDSITKELITYGCISQPSSKNYILRIKDITKEILNLIQKYNIEKIFCEEIRFGDVNTHTFKTLAYLQAYIVCETYLINKNIEFVFFQPSEHRALVGIKTGRGIEREILKQEAIKYVKNKYGIDVNDDIADSITILNASYQKDNEINWE